MEVVATEIKQLKKEVAALKRALANVRATLAARGIQVKVDGKFRKKPVAALTVEEILRQAGLLGELTPGDKARVAEWRKRPPEERERIRTELRARQFDPPLSQIIIENRR